jgi:DNA ligase-1
MTFKPMLAVDHDPAKLNFPIYASPKLDGIRGCVKDGRLLSRSLKPIPNKHVAAVLSQPIFEGLDGELIVGQANDPGLMQACTSFFMSHDKVQPFSYYVFDLHDDERGYDVRYQALIERVNTSLPIPGANVAVVNQTLIHDLDELDRYESMMLMQGYEGVILRKKDGLYKNGRSTVKEGLLLKVKRFTDSEAVVIGFAEQMENTNEKQTNELGRSKRSSHQAGLVGKGTLGALMVRDLATGVEFSIGTGLNDGVREHIWANRDSHEGRIVKYKSFPVGVKDAPRHPVFLSFRSELDMS